MKHLILLLILSIAGCDEMTPAEIGKVKKECESIGMRGSLIVNGYTYGVVKVVCREKLE